MSGTCPDCGERIAGRNPKQLALAVIEHGILHDLLDELQASL